MSLTRCHLPAATSLLQWRPHHPSPSSTSRQIKLTTEIRAETQILIISIKRSLFNFPVPLSFLLLFSRQNPNLEGEKRSKKGIAFSLSPFLVRTISLWSKKRTVKVIALRVEIHCRSIIHHQSYLAFEIWVPLSLCSHLFSTLI